MVRGVGRMRNKGVAAGEGSLLEGRMDKAICRGHLTHKITSELIESVTSRSFRKLRKTDQPTDQPTEHQGFWGS